MSVESAGRIVSAPMIERGLEATLRAWLGWYLAETLVQAGRGRDDLPDPTDLVRVSDFGWPEESQMTLVIVATPGTVGDAMRDAESYTASWEIVASVLCDLGDRMESREAAQYYAAAVGTALDHQGVAATAADGTWTPEPDGSIPALPGSSLLWRGESYRQLGERDGRALIAGGARLQVTVVDARRNWSPLEVPPEPAPGGGGGRDPIDPAESAPVDPSLTIDRIDADDPQPEDL